MVVCLKYGCPSARDGKGMFSLIVASVTLKFASVLQWYNMGLSSFIPECKSASALGLL